MVSENILAEFAVVKHVLEQTKVWDDMKNTVEDSPYHREANVAVHTEMVCEYYINSFIDNNTKYDQMLALLTLLFHDTGKPLAEEEKINKEGLVYRSYAGHEKMSARVWENFAVNNWELLEDLFDFSADAFYTIGWMIEHHLPYGRKRPEKIRALLSMVHKTCGIMVYSDVLLSDCCGRISDEHDLKIEYVVSWLADFADKYAKPDSYYTFEPLEKAKTVYFLIGASGVGKSSYSNANSLNVYSFDQLRINFAVENGILGDTSTEQYTKAFTYSNENKKMFDKLVRDEYQRILNANKSFIVDNTNVSAKSRRTLITQAKQKGFRVVGVLFPINNDTLIERQQTRADKTIPLNVVLRQHSQVSVPFIGTEVDEIHVHMGNV